MDNIIEPTMDYDFSKLYFGPPTTLAGGAYFARIMYNTNKTLFIQTPKCLTKQGFIKSGKKMYTDLMFDNNDTVFINWIENLESRCQDLVYAKRETWFETKLEKDDIETAFTSSFKIFKSGKYYLLRVNVKPNIKIYDENDQIITPETITSDKNIISILEIQGLKFTSRNFQIEIELKQSMIVSPDPFLDECFIKKPTKKTNTHAVEDVNVHTLIEQSVKELTKSNLEETTDLAKTELAKTEEPIQLDVSFEPETITETPAVNTTTNNFFGLEETDITIEEEEDPNTLKEVDVTNTLDNTLETIQLKKPNQVYYEIYQKAREKAKEAKKNAIAAYLEMKNIKKTYMLDDIDESDSEFEEFAESEANSDAESLDNEF